MRFNFYYPKIVNLTISLFSCTIKIKNWVRFSLNWRRYLLSANFKNSRCKFILQSLKVIFEWQCRWISQDWMKIYDLSNNIIRRLIVSLNFWSVPLNAFPAVFAPTLDAPCINRPDIALRRATSRSLSSYSIDLGLSWGPLCLFACTRVECLW